MSVAITSQPKYPLSRAGVFELLTFEDHIEIVRNAWLVSPATKTADMAEMAVNRWFLHPMNCVHGLRSFECGTCACVEGDNRLEEVENSRLALPFDRAKSLIPSTDRFWVPANDRAARTFEKQQYIRTEASVINRFAVDHESWEEIKRNFQVIPINLVVPAVEAEPKEIIKHFLALGVPWTIQTEDGGYQFVLRGFLGLKNSFSAASNRELYTVPRKPRSATVTKAALDQILEIDPQDSHRAAALTQTLVYGVKVADAAKSYGQSEEALTKHRQRILREIRIRFPEDVMEYEPARLQFQKVQFDPALGPGTDPHRWEGGNTE